MKKPLFYVLLSIAIALSAVIATVIIANIFSAAPQAMRPGETPPENTEIPERFDMREDVIQTLIQDRAHEAPLLNYREQGGQFELPISGATGWAARSLALRAEPLDGADTYTTLAPGQGFTIIEESGDWWHVQVSGDTAGWVRHDGCFINFPDIMPSIIYNITNASSSVKRSSGFEIQNITGQILYDARTLNKRLGRFEFVTPVYYPMTEKIVAAQNAALAEGDTIIIVEAFRPGETQQKVVSNLRYLVSVNREVNRAINTPPWSIGAFIATSVSDHQRGAAIDISLARVISMEARATGEYAYVHITEFEQYAMPSAIHELSPQAASSRITPSSGGERLRNYCTEAGLRPLSSEWWHFSCAESARTASRNGINGSFFISSIHSIAPYAVFDNNVPFVFSAGLPRVGDPPSPEPPPQLGEPSTFPENPQEEQLIDAIIEDMSLLEQVSQLFILGLDAEIQESPDALEFLVNMSGAGGYVLFTDENTDTEYLHELTEAIAGFSRTAPFIFSLQESDMVSGPVSSPPPEPPETLESEEFPALRVVSLLEGIVVADARYIQDDTEVFSPAESAVMAVLAGADMIFFMPEDFEEAQNGLLAAIEEDEIMLERIHESLRQIIRIKIRTPAEV